MPFSIKVHYKKELQNAQFYFDNGDLRASWNSLERSHILGQPFGIEHTYTHWLMLQFGLKTKNTREILGQLPRLIFGGVKSFVGVIPKGNTGGANVHPLKPMPIPLDLKMILNKNKI